MADPSAKRREGELALWSFGVDDVSPRRHSGMDELSLGDLGPRPLCLGLHGWGGSHITFQPFVRHLPWDRLPVGYRLLAPDLPGYGSTPAPEALLHPSASLDLVVEPITALLRDLPGPPVDLLGNCSGAILGLLAAQRAPGRVRRLILLDPFARMPWYFRIFTLGDFGRIAYRTAFANPLGRWLTNGALRRHRTGETDLTLSFERVDHRVTLAYMRLLTEIACPEVFTDLSHLPIDLVHGDRTFAAVRRSVPVWQTVWPDARVTVLPGAGHLPLREAPAALAALLADFPPEPGETEPIGAGAGALGAGRAPRSG